MNEKEYRPFTEKERKWIDEFKKVMKKAPVTLFLFAGDGTLVVYAGHVMNDSGSVDGYNTNELIRTPMVVDGGDW